MTLCRESELLEKIEQLQAEVRYWRSEAQEKADNRVVARFIGMFRLTPTEAWILAALYAANGKPVKRLALLEQHPGTKLGDDRVGNGVDVLMSRVRGKIGKDYIHTVRSVGYVLTAAGIAMCDDVLREELAA